MDLDDSIRTETRDNYTILRIKRKRTDEPLEALVIESKRRKSRGGVDVFQFAETVEAAAWDDEARTKDLQERITELARRHVERSVAGTKRTDAALSPVDLRPPKSARHYKILPQLHEQAEPLPIVPSKKPEQAKDYRMYDAVLQTESSKQPSLEDDPEMANFLPMLQDYLKVNDADPVAKSSASTPSAPVPIAAPAPLPPTDDPDYVWDVFYHRAGLTDDLEELPVANIGTLTGLPGSFETGESSDEESVEGDEADEDSNDEGFYRNDYPEEEDESDDGSEGSDIFHDGSSAEDVSADLDFYRGYR